MADTASTKSTKKSASKPQSMEELLAQADYTFVIPQKGSTVKGTISQINKKSLVVDIGAKTEGLVTDKEFALAENYVTELNEGDKIEATVISSENDKGQILLSLKKAALDARWQRFEELLESQETIAVKGIEVNKGGLIASFEGFRGFVPSSQFGKKYMGKIKTLKNKTVDVKVIEVEQDKNRLIFSERHVSEANEIAQRDAALNNVEDGKIYSGVVSGVMHFGLFVTVEIPVDKDGGVGHVEGLVHISEISWEKVNDPRDYHKVGDELQVKVLGIDEDTGKLNLSIKQLSDDPWISVAERYPVGTTFTGTVSRVENFGVFVNAEAGIDGLMHNSKLDGQNYQVGEEVTVTVESVDADQRRMSLSPVLTELPVNYK